MKKKKIKDLTFEEMSKICGTNNCKNCPLNEKYLVSCYFNAYKMIHFFSIKDREVEVDEEN